MTDTTIPPALARIAAAARRLGPPDPTDDGDELAALSLPGAKAEKSLWDEAALQLIRDARALLLRSRQVVPAHTESPWLLGVDRWLAEADAFVDDRPGVDVA